MAVLLASILFVAIWFTSSRHIKIQKSEPAILTPGPNRDTIKVPKQSPPTQSSNGKILPFKKRNS